jgi:hypothetical protein
VREWRTRTRLRKTLVDERTGWLQRIQATLFHHGIGGVPDQLLRVRGRAFLAELELPDAARERIEVALAMIDALDRQLAPLWARHPRAGAPPGGLPEADAQLRHRAGHRDRHRRRARRRVAAVGVAQGGPLRRPRRRRAPLRPALAAGEADPAGIATTALGALRGRITSPGHQAVDPDKAGRPRTTAPTTTAELHNHSPPTLTTAPVQIGALAFALAIPGGRL